MFLSDLKSAGIMNEHIPAVHLLIILSLLLKRANKHRMVGMWFRVEGAFAFLCNMWYSTYYKTFPDLQYFKRHPWSHIFKPPFSVLKQYRVFFHALKAKKLFVLLRPCLYLWVYVHSWVHLRHQTKDLSTALKEICQFCADISYFAGVTLLGVYVNLVRRRFNNLWSQPCKRFSV